MAVEEIKYWTFIGAADDVKTAAASRLESGMLRVLCSRRASVPPGAEDCFAEKQVRARPTISWPWMMWCKFIGGQNSQGSKEGA